MTVTEKEEEGNSSSSNTKIVEIKKEQVEEEEEDDEGGGEDEEVYLWLNEYVKGPDFKDEQLQKAIAKALIEEEEEDAEESERSTKRTRTTESDEAESTIKQAANVEGDATEWGMDPLDVTEEIVLKYHDYIHEIYEMVKDEPKEVRIQWQKWSEILKRGSVLVEDLKQGLRTVAIDMEWMKSIDEFKKEYSLREVHVPDLIALLRDINSRIETSPNFRLVSDSKNREEVLKLCLHELERSKEELTEMVEVIQELRELDLQDDEDGEDGEDEEDEELVLEFEDAEFEELDVIVDEETKTK